MATKDADTLSPPVEYLTANCTSPIAEKSAPANAFNSEPRALEGLGIAKSSNDLSPKLARHSAGPKQATKAIVASFGRGAKAASGYARQATNPATMPMRTVLTCAWEEN